MLTHSALRGEDSVESCPSLWMCFRWFIFKPYNYLEQCESFLDPESDLSHSVVMHDDVYQPGFNSKGQSCSLD